MTEKIDHTKVQSYSLQYAEALMERFFSGAKTFIQGNDLLTFSEVKQVNFFILKSLFVNWQQEMDRLKSPYFDYESPEVKTAMGTFMNTISRHIKVSKKDLMPITISAIQETIYLLISPFEFFHADFSQYNLKDIDVSFLEKELKYVKINRGLLEALIDEIKNNHGGVADQAMVISILESLITDKNEIEDAASYLEKFSTLVPLEKKELLVDTTPAVDEVTQEQINTTEPEQLVEAKEDDRKAENIATQTQVEEKTIEVEKEEVTEQIIQEVPTPTVAIHENNDESLEELEEELGISPVDNEKTEVNTTSLNDAFAAPKTVLNDKLKSPNPEPPLAQVLENKANPDTLLNTMSINHGYMFINELFNGNADEFNLAMERIETCKNFDGAVELLVQKYARPFKWDMNSKEVKELLKVIFRRFR